MKTFVALFLIAAGFGAATWIAYFFVAHEETFGTTALAFMTGALAFAASYAIVAERNARLDGDKPSLPMEAAAGEAVAVVTKSSAYPILAALFILISLVGLLWAPLLAAIALAGVLWSLWRLGAESART